MIAVPFATVTYSQVRAHLRHRPKVCLSLRSTMLW